MGAVTWTVSLMITTLLRVVLFPLCSKKKLRVLEFIRSHASSKQQRPAGRGDTAVSSDGGVSGQGYLDRADFTSRHCSSQSICV